MKQKLMYISGSCVIARRLMYFDQKILDFTQKDFGLDYECFQAPSFN